MATHIADCKTLVDIVLPALSEEGALKVMIGANPGKLVQNYPLLAVALYAQCLSDEPIIVNLMMPGVRSFLKRLAHKGVGFSE
ncbi:hypothetical protein ACJZ2D_003871 [Fusarium nematophilum]